MHFPIVPVYIGLQAFFQFKYNIIFDDYNKSFSIRQKAKRRLFSTNEQAAFRQ
jgi:hypothetical protein